MTARLSVEAYQVGWGEHGEHLRAEPVPTLRCQRCGKPLVAPHIDVALWRPDAIGSTVDVEFAHRPCLPRQLPVGVRSLTVHRFLTQLREGMVQRPGIEPWVRAKRKRDEAARQARADQIRAQNGGTPPKYRKPAAVFVG